MTRSTECMFYDPERCREDRYDFASLRLPPATCRLFARAFRGMMGAVRVSSRRQAWHQMERFARFLTQQSQGVERSLSDANLLTRFHRDLLQDQVCATTLSSRFNMVRRLLTWVAEDGGCPDPAIFRGPPPQFPQRVGSSSVPHELAAEDLRRVVSPCKREIDQVFKDFSVRERFERGEHVDSRPH